MDTQTQVRPREGQLQAQEVLSRSIAAYGYITPEAQVKADLLTIFPSGNRS